jgi:hypothetical protein
MELGRKMTLQLRDSQKVALEILTEPGRHFAALWAEPRSGKTAVALKWIQHVKPEIVVVVGPKIAEATWKTEAAKWLDATYRFFPLTAGNAYPSPSMFRGITLMFVNYDQFSKSPWKKLGPFLRQLAKLAEGKGMMLLDESHMIKTPSSVQGRNIRPLAHRWYYRLLMTGTPVTNPSQIDAVYGQWTFLDPEIRNEWPSARDFREHFGEWTTVKGFPELVRPRNQYELNKYLQPNVITMTGVGNPVPIHKVVYSVPDTVMGWHRAMSKKGVLYIGDHAVIGLNPLTRLLRMRMLVGGWLKDDEGDSFTVKDAAKARLRALEGVLRKCNGKVIIACTHLHEIKLVKRYLRLKRMRHLVITGATPDKSHVIEQFQRDRTARVLLVQPRTVSMAVDISVANDLIWYTSDFNYVTFKQASDRIKLSPASPRVWFLCGRGTVDEDVWITLQEDHNHLRKVIRRIRKKSSP